jgi:phage terminase large subunit-like protein
LRGSAAPGAVGTASQPGDRIVMSWDIALSEIESGDYSACVVLLIRKVVYILEVVRGRFPFEALKKKVMELKRKYNPRPPRRPSRP